MALSVAERKQLVDLFNEVLKDLSDHDIQGSYRANEPLDLSVVITRGSGNNQDILRPVLRTYRRWEDEVAMQEVIEKPGKK